jgi:putative ABC transport system ATP-binding protein
VNREIGSTTVVITHNVAIAEMAHRVLYMADGLISHEHVNEVRANPRDITW